MKVVVVCVSVTLLLFQLDIFASFVPLLQPSSGTTTKKILNSQEAVGNVYKYADDGPNTTETFEEAVGNVSKYAEEEEDDGPNITDTFQEAVGNDDDDDDDDSNITDTIRPITDAIKKQQIENYRTGKALLLNFHPTHHGGTSFCAAIGKTGGPVASPKYPEDYPKFACMGLKDGQEDLVDKAIFRQKLPVKYDKVDQYIHAIRPHFHVISWEFSGVGRMKNLLSETNLEHLELASVVITRNPLSRILAGSGLLTKKYVGYNSGGLSHSGWWDLASSRKESDNFFLRMLDGTEMMELEREDSIVSEEGFIYAEDNLPTIDSLRPYFNLNETNYQNALGQLNRFTIVLDIECLDDGFVALTDLLGLNSTLVDNARARLNDIRKKKGKDKRPSTRERIGYEDVYEYLLEKHEWDIKLYEYSKTISLVNCDEVKKNRVGSER